ncbi:MAG: FMN-binding negative transcriptional regulator [Candidatus Limnocylindrales bacterium]
MYVPDHFRTSHSDILDLLTNFGAAELVTNTPDGLRATMLPMIYEAATADPDADIERLEGDLGVLRGHFARKNDHWQKEALGQALVIINGPDAYITPTWYATKREHGRVVPTWNYITAHVYGELTVHDDVAWVETNVRELTHKYEARRNPRWAVTDAPPEYIYGQLRAIVGVEITVTRVDTKWKLSQNRSLDDVMGVVEGVAADGRKDMAEAVRRAAVGRDR